MQDDPNGLREVTRIKGQRNLKRRLDHLDEIHPSLEHYYYIIYDRKNKKIEYALNTHKGTQKNRRFRSMRDFMLRNGESANNFTGMSKFIEDLLDDDTLEFQSINEKNENTDQENGVISIKKEIKKDVLDQ